MKLSIEIATDRPPPEYDAFVQRHPAAMLYAGSTYHRFLHSVLSDSESVYFLARQRGQLVGVLPAFIKRQKEHGSVLNSLPFYGSNGGPMVLPGAHEESVVWRLLEASRTYCETHAVAASTLITNPLLPQNHKLYTSALGSTFRDERIGQLRELPQRGTTVGVGSELMATVHETVRRAIRKAQRNDVQVSHTSDPAALGRLAQLHSENISSIGGLAKPYSVFERIPEIFTYDHDYRVYVAVNKGVTIAALLVFYYNGVVEYFTPATDVGYRGLQPMSLLVFTAMQDAVRRSCRWWNWGGTWVTQDGVYRFKKRWGTVDRRYFYHTTIFNKGILRCSAEQLLEAYPYFYVVPFSQL